MVLTWKSYPVRKKFTKKDTIGAHFKVLRYKKRRLQSKINRKHRMHLPGNKYEKMYLLQMFNNSGIDFAVPLSIGLILRRM